MFAERILVTHVAIGNLFLFLEAYKIDKADWLPRNTASWEAVQLQFLVKLPVHEGMSSVLQPLEVDMPRRPPYRERINPSPL